MIHYWPEFVGIADPHGLNLGWANGFKASVRWTWRGREHRLRFRLGRLVKGGWGPTLPTWLPRLDVGHNSWIQEELDALIRGGPLPICDRCKKPIRDGITRTISSAGWTVHTLLRDCPPPYPEGETPD